MRLWRSMSPSFSQLSDKWCGLPIILRGADTSFFPRNFAAPMLNSVDTQFRTPQSRRWTFESRHMVCFPYLPFFFFLPVRWKELELWIGTHPANPFPQDTTTAVEALEKGLDSLMDLCDVVTDKFTAARDTFNAEQADRMESWAQFGIRWVRLFLYQIFVSGSVLGLAFLL